MGKINNETINIRALEKPETMSVYRQWAKVNESLQTFEKKATLKTFEYLYGKDAERLFKHFRIDCKGKFQQFMTYLTQEQKNELIVNCHEDIELYL